MRQGIKDVDGDREDDKDPDGRPRKKPAHERDSGRKDGDSRDIALRGGPHNKRTVRLPAEIDGVDRKIGEVVRACR